MKWACFFFLCVLWLAAAAAVSSRVLAGISEHDRSAQE
jgi:hypothetical protein